MTSTLPSILQTYFDAQNAHDADLLVDCFTPDAKVRDEGEDIVGHAAIRAWKKKVSDKYHITITPLRHWQENGHDLVSANVEGTFPGSPIEFTYRFTLKNDLIAALMVLA
jgi:ketosteroid isomerase-like protein